MQPARRGHSQRNMADTSGQARAPPPPPPCPPPPPPHIPPQSQSSIGTWYAVHSDTQGEKNFFCDENTDEVRRDVVGSRAMPVAVDPPRSRDGDDSSFDGSLGDLCGAVTDRSKSDFVVSKDAKLRSNGNMNSSRGATATRYATLVPLPNWGDIAWTNCNADPPYLRDQWQTTQDQQERAVFLSRITSKPPSRSSDLKESAIQTLERPAKESASNDVTNVYGGARWSYPKKGPGCPEKKSLQEKEVDERSPSPLRMTVVREDEASESRDSTSRRESCVPDVLLEVERWLKNNDPEYDHSPANANSSVAGQKERDSYSSKGRALAPPHNSPGVEDGQRVKIIATESTMRETKLREVEEITGRPEITRLGRSKQRSVDDLFLYQRSVEANRRRKQGEAQATEDGMRTGRPETCTRSKLLVEQMRRRKCDNTHVPTSERLYNEAREQRQRREDRRAFLDTAVRLRASPKLTASSRVLSPDRGDVGQRLYEQGLLKKQDAREREHFARHAPRGATFHPEIIPRSVLLARRRRRAKWATCRQRGVSEGETGGGSAHLVEEGLLAEGVIYKQRRQQRLQRQQEIDEILRRSATLNRHSAYLLRKVQKRGLVNVAVAGVIRRDRSRTSKTAEDIHGMEQATFSPTLKALGASTKILKSRYGQGALPSMEERTKEWEMRCLERRKMSAGREQLIAESARGHMNQHITESRPASNLLDVAGVDRNARRNTDIYERSAVYLRRRDRRRTVQREARLTEEMTDCTFEPCLSARRGSRGNHTRPQRPSSTSSGRIHFGGRDDNNGIPLPLSSSSGSPTDRGWWTHGYHRSGQRDNESAPAMLDRDALGVHHGDGLRHEGIPEKRAAKRPALPSGWFDCTTPEGRVYYFFADTALVQWDRPTE